MSSIELKLRCYVDQDNNEPMTELFLGDNDQSLRFRNSESFSLANKLLMACAFAESDKCLFEILSDKLGYSVDEANAVIFALKLKRGM